MKEEVAAVPATSYIGTVLSIAQLLKAYGVDGNAVLAEAGIDVNAAPGFKDRVPADLLHDTLIKRAQDKIDPLFGLRFADYVNPTTYHAFGVMLMASTTLRAFCQRLERYYAYINTADSVTLGEGGELYISQFLSPAYRDHPMEVMIHEAGWASTMVKMVRLVARPDYGPERVTMSFDEPEGYAEAYTAYFRCPVQFGADRAAIWFDEDDLDQALPGGNAEIARQAESLVYKYLRTFTPVDIVNAVRMTLFDLLPRGNFDLDTLAAELDMMPEQLTEALKQRGTGYRQLLGETRRELAEEYIMRADISVNEIAYMLGFSDCSNLARSFRRWKGVSPTDFREQLKAS